MFGWFKSNRSPLRRRLEESISVHRTWYEWTLENGRPEAMLVIELAYDSDPDSPNFDREGLDEIVATLTMAAPGEAPPARVKLIPRMYGL